MIAIAVVVLPFLGALGSVLDRTGRVIRLAPVVLVAVVLLAVGSTIVLGDQAASGGIAVLGVTLGLRPAPTIAIVTATLIAIAALAVGREQTFPSGFVPAVLLASGGISLAAVLSGNAVAVGLALGFVVAVLLVVVVPEPTSVSSLRTARRYLTWTTLASSALILSGTLDRLYARQPGPGILGAVAGLFVVGIGIAVAALPLALWLPGLAEDAPLGAGIATAFITSGALAAVAGALGADPWLMGDHLTQEALATVGGFGSILSVVLALGEKRPSRVFAYLISANAGFAVTTLALSPRGDSAGAIWLLGSQALAGGLGFLSLAAADGRISSLFWRRPMAAAGSVDRHFYPDWSAANGWLRRPSHCRSAIRGATRRSPSCDGRDKHYGWIGRVRSFGTVFDRSDVTRERFQLFDVAAFVVGAVIVLAGVLPSPILALLH